MTGVASAPTLNRRVGGGLVLLAALVAALVVPKILNPDGIAGRPAVAPAPPPLVVGDCIAGAISGSIVSHSVVADTNASTTAELLTSAPITVAPCGSTHTGEIVLAAAPPGGGTDADPSVAAFTNRCRTVMTTRWQFADTVAASWSPQLTMVITVIGPDPRQVAAGQRWIACAVAPVDGPIDRPLSALPDGDGPPPLFGSCSRYQSGSDSAVTVGCAAPHTTEELGVRDLERGSPLDQDDLAASCVELAVAVTGRPGLPADPSLAVDTFVYARYDSGDTSPVLAPIPVDAAGGRVTCSVRVTDDRSLTASLRRIGDGPLPWTR